MLNLVRWNGSQSFPMTELTAMYTMADVCLVTPMRDGMNLVCKEYVASRSNQDGVLVLSELAGASHELVDALIINPTNIQSFSDTIYDALVMPEPEVRHRMRALQKVVRRFNVHYWADSFFNKLGETRLLQEKRRTKRMTQKLEQDFYTAYNNAEKRLLLLDYDGTLVGFKQEPEQAYPDEALYTKLDKLASDPKNTLVLISGRKHEHLETWFGSRGYHLVAEHGVWCRMIGNEWKVRMGLSNQWQSKVRELMCTISDRTPGARIENKSHSIAWHYRKVQTELGMMRSNELVEGLRDYAAMYGLQILEGSKVIEVRHAGINKGTAVLDILEHDEFDFIFAAGDDRTDEDIFLALPEDALTVKVGAGDSNAQLFVPSYREVRRMLARIVDVEPSFPATLASSIV